MHHGSLRRGALQTFRTPVVLFNDTQGRPVTFKQWQQLPRQLPAIRTVEVLVMLVTDGIPSRRSPQFDRAVNTVLGGNTMTKLAQAIRELPSGIRPRPMTKLQLLSFALRLSSRLVRAAA